MKNKGFTTIKLITLLLLISLIVLLIYPKLSNYLKDDKEEKFINIAKEAIAEVQKEIESSNYKTMPDKSNAILIPLTNIESFQITSPYGKFDTNKSYVIVTNISGKYRYYFGATTNKKGIPIVRYEELNKDSITSGDSLKILQDYNKLQTITVDDTVYKVSSKNKEEDKNILLEPVNEELQVTYEFKEEIYKIYSTLIKEKSKDELPKDVSITNGILRYNGVILGNNYSKDLTGIFSSTYFINEDNTNQKEYYTSFVVSNNTYVAGTINEHNNYTNQNMKFSSSPIPILYEKATTVKENDTISLSFTSMVIYPNNTNYEVESCGIILKKSNNIKIENLTLETENIQLAKTVNGCDNGSIYKVRKNNPLTNDKWYARAFVTYYDTKGQKHTVYSDNITSGKRS